MASGRKSEGQHAAHVQRPTSVPACQFDPRGVALNSGLRDSPRCTIKDVMVQRTKGQGAGKDGMRRR
jgi:hypothetical protein